MFEVLQEGYIHIYYTKASGFEPVSQTRLLRILTEEERQLYQRIKFENKKIEFLLGRYLVKSIIACYLNIRPEDVRFARNIYGKPYLIDDLDCESKAKVKFNLSHSSGIVACAVTLEHELGMDLQKINGDLTDIAKRFFAAEEIQYIFNHPEQFHNEMAYKLWTLKEAYMKAKGMGLALKSKSFNVFEIEEMCFDTMIPEPGYILSIAVEKKNKIQFEKRVKEIYCI